MGKTPKRGIGDDHPGIEELRKQLVLGALLPSSTEPHRLAGELRNLPTLPDRFNEAFIEQGWVFVEFACGIDAAESALQMCATGASHEVIDAYLAANLLAVQPIRWQSLKLLGGGMAEPLHPVRAEVTERALDAYEAGDYLVAVPLILMLVDGFGVSATGTKSIFSDLDDLDELFQSTESMAGHPSALKPLLKRLRGPARGYSEDKLSLPLRNGILHGTRLNYASEIVAAKALNLLAAIVEWAADVAPELKDQKARARWNEKFLRANLDRLRPDSADRALDLLASALARRHWSDVVALIDYHPVHTRLDEKVREWRELDHLDILIDRSSGWELFGPDRPGRTGRCQVRLSLRTREGALLSESHERVFAGLSTELQSIGVKAYWQISLNLLGTIRARLSDG